MRDLLLFNESVSRVFSFWKDCETRVKELEQRNNSHLMETYEATPIELETAISLIDDIGMCAMALMTHYPLYSLTQSSLWRIVELQKKRHNCNPILILHQQYLEAIRVKKYEKRLDVG
jgi:hypothetical protein